MKTSLVMTASMESTARACGMPLDGLIVPVCGLQVGDVISSPGRPGVLLKVTQRVLRIGTADTPPQWFAYVEQTSRTELPSV